MVSKFLARATSKCLFCEKSLEHTFFDLGIQQLWESFISSDRLNCMEPFYPLHTYVCGSCFLVQLQEYVSPKDIFYEIAYFSFSLPTLRSGWSMLGDMFR